ncbi:MAG: hypothetical protein M0004_06720 [Actinomycetota bacterium]|nr:hypothetical protein [Actinomycetota bacterium]
MRSRAFGGALAVLVVAPPSFALAVPASAAAASVAIASPSNGAVLDGSVTVDVVATDASDPPASITLTATVNGVTSSLGSVTCDGFSASCSGSVTWTPASSTTSAILVAELQTAGGAVLDSSPVPVLLRSEPPTATIVSPSAGAVLDGTVSVEVSGSTDPNGTDSPSELVLDDTSGGKTTEVGSTQCLSAALTPATSCSGAITWDTTGLSGTQSLTAQVFTTNGASATSAPVAVTVATPPPTASIASPLAGSVVRGLVEVDVSGATSPGVADSPSDLALYDDDNGTTTEVGDFPCLSGVLGATTCSAQIAWDTSGLGGPQILTAEVTTQNGTSATSPPVTIDVFAKSRFVLARLPIAHLGQRTVVQGSLESTPDGTGLAGAEVALSVHPVLGAVRVLRTRTSGTGHFAFSLVAHGRATYELAVSPTAAFTAASARATQLVAASATCHLAFSSLPAGGKDALACVLPGLRRGIHLVLEAAPGTTWAPLATGTTEIGGRVALHFLAPPPGTSRLRLVVAATPTTITTVVALPSLRVRA